MILDRKSNCSVPRKADSYDLFGRHFASIYSTTTFTSYERPSVGVWGSRVCIATSGLSGIIYLYRVILCVHALPGCFTFDGECVHIFRRFRWYSLPCDKGPWHFGEGKSFSEKRRIKTGTTNGHHKRASYLSLRLVRGNKRENLVVYALFGRQA